jgi:conjugative transposon TraM protein
MQVQETSLQRKQKALLLLPLLIIPCLTLAFWALGGGQENGAAKGDDKSGVNMQLPRAQLDSDDDKTKLSFYEDEEKRGRGRPDSLPGFGYRTEKAVNEPPAVDEGQGRALYDPKPPFSFPPRDPNEEKVYQKLAELNSTLTHSSASGIKAGSRPVLPMQKRDETDDDIRRLAGVLPKNEPKRERDPELEQLNDMMEKVLDIQHPERVKTKLIEKNADVESESLPVYRAVPKAEMSLLDTGMSSQKSEAAFWSLRNDEKQLQENAIEAAAYQTQTLASGSVITFRVLTDFTVAGSVFPKGSLLSGTCSLNEERLEVQIMSIRRGSSLYPVQLEAYDLDGIRGIYIPGAVTRDVAKGSAEEAAQMLQLSTLDPSLKAQATSAGIGAVKSLLSKKIKRVRVVVKAGYRVLLRQKNA